MRNDVIVGTGGMGAAIAHRLGSGRTIVLSDVSSQSLDAVVRTPAESDSGPRVGLRAAGSVSTTRKT
jgi:3-hydroxyacyl-CoA dehydrogenase